MATLAIATSRLNSRLRHGGMSFQTLCARDQYTQSALSISDRKLISQRHDSRTSNLPYNYTSKSRTHSRLPSADIAPGDLVYHAGDRDKTRDRPRTAVDGEWCSVRKFASSQLRSKQYLPFSAEAVSHQLAEGHVARGTILTKGHVAIRENCNRKIAMCISMCIDGLNTMRTSASLCINSVRSYRHKGILPYMTGNNLVQMALIQN